MKKQYEVKITKNIFIFIILLLVSPTTISGNSQQAVTEWTQNVTQVIESILQNIKYDDYQGFYDELDRQDLYRTVPFSLNDLVANLTRVFSIKAGIVSDLQNTVETAYAQRNVEPSTSCSYYHPGNLPPLTYDNRFNLNVSFESSMFKIAPETSTTSAAFRSLTCFTTELDKTFIKYKERTLFQYFASIEGAMKMYPAQQWPDDYDARFESWYVQSSSGPKDIVIVIDTSGSMSGSRISKAREAANLLLSGLTDSDYVNVVQFNSAASTSSCFSNRLFRGTPQNIEALTDYVNSLNANGLTNYEAAFNKAFDLISNTASANLGSKCKTAILFLTDGEPTVGSSNVAPIINRRKGDKDVSVFTFALGVTNEDALDTLRTIACQNKGLFFRFGDGDDIATKMGSYYQFFAAGISSSYVSWSLPYVDDPEIGLVITASLPVYDRSSSPPRLIGVVGTDISVTDVLNNISFDGAASSSYAFLVNRDGETYVHPYLPRPTEISDALYFDIEELEFSAGSQFNSVRTGLLSGVRGNSGPLTIQKFIPLGEQKYGGVEQSVTLTYYWEPIQGTPLTLGYALSQKDISKKEISSYPTIQPADIVTNYYHLVDLYPEPYRTDLNITSLLSHKTHPFARVSSHTTVKIGPSGFKDSYSYLTSRETNNSVGVMHRLLNAISLPNDNPPELQDQVLYHVIVSSQLENRWISSFPFSNISDFVWIYAESPGVSRYYPGASSDKSYDSSFTTWYLRGVAYAGKIALDVPSISDSGAGKVSTFVRGVYEGNRNGDRTNSKITAIIGIDILYSDFLNKLNEATPSCHFKSGSASKCFLIDQGGYFLTYPTYSFTSGNVEWIGLREKKLASALISNGLMTNGTAVDFENNANCLTYKVIGTQLVLGNIDSSCVFWFSPLQGNVGNAYLVGYEGSSCNDGTATVTVPSCTKRSQNLCNPVSRPRALATCPDFILTDEQIQSLRGENTCSGASNALINMSFGFFLLFLCSLL